MRPEGQAQTCSYRHARVLLPHIIIAGKPVRNAVQSRATAASSPPSRLYAASIEHASARAVCVSVALGRREYIMAVSVTEVHIASEVASSMHAVRHGVTTSNLLRVWENLGDFIAASLRNRKVRTHVTNQTPVSGAGRPSIFKIRVCAFHPRQPLLCLCLSHCYQAWSFGSRSFEERQLGAALLDNSD